MNKKSLDEKSLKTKGWTHGPMSEDDLRHFVSHAVTLAGLCVEGLDEDPIFEDNLRMISSIDARFIGRAAYYSWTGDMTARQIEQHFELAEAKAKLVYELCPDLILQAGIFEIIYRDTVNNTKISRQVFDAFNLAPEDRNYSFDAMLFEEGSKYGVGYWGNPYSAVPCIFKLETRMYFYDLICRYIDAGYEAFHLGQAELMMAYSGNSNAHHWMEVTQKARAYAASHARRGIALFDCHTAIDSAGIKVGEKLVMDIQGAGLVPDETIEKDGALMCRISGYEDNWLQWIGRSDGGIHPMGFTIENNLTILEFDNYGGNGEPGVPTYQAFYNWGYDDISWFALQPEWYRNQFLEECHHFLSNNYLDSKGRQVYYLQPSCRRVITDEYPILKYKPGDMYDPEFIKTYEITGGSVFDYDEKSHSYKVTVKRDYKANKMSDSCPDGFGQEDTIRKIFKSI